MYLSYWSFSLCLKKVAFLKEAWIESSYNCEPRDVILMEMNQDLPLDWRFNYIFSWLKWDCKMKLKLKEIERTRDILYDWQKDHTWGRKLTPVGKKYRNEEM